MVSFLSRSPANTKRLAVKILALAAKKKLEPIIFALSGELGSGKTTFIQGLAQTLGIREKVQSPTFVLMKWYKLPRLRHSFRHLIHIDAYRIDSLAEAKHLGLKEIFKDRDAIIVVEWAERIRKLMPRGVVWIKFEYRRKIHERIIKVNE